MLVLVLDVWVVLIAVLVVSLGCIYMLISVCQTAQPDTTNRSSPTRAPQCVTPCQTCTTQTQCLTCLPNFFFYNSQCITNCPSFFTIEDPINRLCLSCSPICLTCSITINNCTSCNVGLAMQAGQCVSQCADGLYIAGTACVG